MTGRERFQRIMQYQPVDRLPVLFLEPYEGATLDRWRGEGLPGDVWPDTFFGLDAMRLVPWQPFAIPPFELRRIAEDEESYTETDIFGAVVHRSRNAPAMYYGYVDHPVKTLADWQRMVERYQAATPGRHPEDLEATIAALNAADTPVVLQIFPFFFRLGFYLLGMERFMTAFYEEPELLHAMFSHWGQYTLELVRPYLGKVKIDAVTFAEDLAYKTSTHLSPRLYEEFWLPHQAPLIAALQEAGVPLICMWSAGQLDQMLPVLLRNGFNCTWPLERGSGMDPLAVREKYGRALRLGGGIAKETLIAGPAAIDRELERLMPLIVDGGFIPAIDDMIPPEVPFAHVRHYLEAVRAVRL